MNEPLFWNLRPSETGRQLILFPFLGGYGASFNALIRNLRQDWDVWTANPPGHGPSKLDPIGDIGELVDLYAEQIATILKPGAVVFGHSMGGMIAYFVLRDLYERERPASPCRLPADLVISAANAPSDLPVSGWSTASERALLQHLETIEAIPGEIAADRSLVDFFLPAFRADYSVLEQARQLSATALDVRAHLILGERDPQVSRNAAVSWQRYFRGPLRTHVLPGEGHMFIQHAFDPLNDILDEVRENPTRVLAVAAVDG